MEQSRKAPPPPRLPPPPLDATNDPSYLAAQLRLAVGERPSLQEEEEEETNFLLTERLNRSLNSECESGYDESPSECDLHEEEEDGENEHDKKGGRQQSPRGDEEEAVTGDVETFTDEGRVSVESRGGEDAEDDSLASTAELPSQDTQIHRSMVSKQPEASDQPSEEDCSSLPAVELADKSADRCHQLSIRHLDSSLSPVRSRTDTDGTSGAATPFPPSRSMSPTTTKINSPRNTPQIISFRSFTPPLINSRSFTPPPGINSRSFTPPLVNSRSFTPPLTTSRSFTPPLITSRGIITPPLIKSRSFTPPLIKTPVAASETTPEPPVATKKRQPSRVAAGRPSSSIPRPRKPTEAATCSRGCGAHREQPRTAQKGRRRLQLWEIQKTLGRGDFIEGVLNIDTRNGQDNFICAPVHLGRGDGHLDWSPTASGRN